MFCFLTQKAAYEVRISDWSADVCSSVLAVPRRDRLAHLERIADGDDIVADMRPVGIAEWDLLQATCRNAQDGNIRVGIATEKLGLDLPIAKPDGDRAGILDDVVVRDHKSARGIYDKP